MERLSDEPYRVTFEIVNKQCKGINLLRDLGVDQFTLNDVRALTGGSTRHLVRMLSKQIHQLPKPSP